MRFLLGLLIGLIMAFQLPRTYFRYWYDETTIMEGDRVRFKDKDRDGQTKNCRLIVKSTQATENRNMAWLFYECGPNKYVGVITVDQDDIYRSSK